MCFLCTRINGGRMHYTRRLFGFKASSVQRYFLIPGQPYIVLPSFEISNRFWRLHLKANFLKVPSNIAIAELSSSTRREISRPTTSHLMMQQLEHAARGSHRDGNQPNSAILPDQCLFCKKSKYKLNTKTREKLHSVQEFLTDDLNVPFAPTKG